MNKIIFFTIYVAIWITAVNIVLSSLQHSIKEMERFPVAAKESQSRVAEMRDITLHPEVVTSYDADH